MFQPGPDWSGPPMAVLLNKTDLLSEEQIQVLKDWYTNNCRAEQVNRGRGVRLAIPEVVSWVGWGGGGGPSSAVTGTPTAAGQIMWVGGAPLDTRSPCLVWSLGGAGE